MYREREVIYSINDKNKKHHNNNNNSNNDNHDKRPGRAAGGASKAAPSAAAPLSQMRFLGGSRYATPGLHNNIPA